MKKRSAGEQASADPNLAAVLTTLALLAASVPACVVPREPYTTEEEPGEQESEVDACPVTGGISHAGQTRFLHGVNFAWDNFSADFGGIPEWGTKGISETPDVFETQLADMHKNGARVVRWWVFPDLRGDGIVLDGKGTPVSLGGTANADLEKALDLAEKTDVYLILCLFSFDGFHPGRDVEGVWVPSLAPIVVDATKRQALMKNVVRPLAAIAQKSNYKNRLLAWEVINEPEWAMKGQSPYGDPDYTPMAELDAVPHAVMETFVADTIAALRAEGSVKVTLGSAGLKWARAWSLVDVDFYQVHWYDWLTPYWPTSKTPSEYGLGDKPVLVGEMPAEGVGGKSFAQLSSMWLDAGYAGALAWDYPSMDVGEMDQMSSFAKAHSCETSFAGTSGGGDACTDVAPDGQYTCAQQAGWGKCDEAWMAGKCDQSCGRC